jgi:Ethanolamine utilization protein EutJ (predicted chaperonin)
LKLFDTAVEIIERTQVTMGSRISWTIGGGTMRHELFAHRFSRDIGVFVNDPQVLLYLTPRTIDVAEYLCEVRSPRLDDF